MYSPAAWPPCQANTAPVKATPMLIHTADSMAASLVVGAWGVRWTRSRSAISRVETNARNATQIQIGTSKLAKFSRELDDSDARTARDTCYLRLYPDGLPAEGLARRGGRARRANRGRIDDRARRGYSPSVHGSLPAVAGDPKRQVSGCPSPAHPRWPGLRPGARPVPGTASTTRSRAQPAGRTRSTPGRPRARRIRPA